jgi:hypothetical protein
MSNLLRNVSSYRERAAECVRLAKIASDPAIREGFRKLAEAYLTLAKADGHAEQEAHTKKLTPSG